MFIQNSPYPRWLTWLLIALLLTTSLIGLASLAAAQSTTITIATDDLFAQIYDRTSPSVVAIQVTVRVANAAVPGQTITGTTEGTGIVLDTTGHILTNNHVVDSAVRIEIAFIDGTQARAEIVGLDPYSDLAVLLVDLPAEQLSQLRPAEFGDSDNLRIGQTVLAIGSPFGQGWTLTSGIISALDRTIQGLTAFSIGGVIQTDTAINPGNSGGPLLDLDGRVIGVNSQIASESGSSSGIGFAIPGNLALRVAQTLIEQGEMEYSYLGITHDNINLAIIEALQLPNNTRGIVIMEVIPNSPADRAGLLNPVIVGSGNQRHLAVLDIITGIDGTPMLNTGDLTTYLATHTRPGQTVTLTVLRNGTEELSVEVTLATRP